MCSFPMRFLAKQPESPSPRPAAGVFLCGDPLLVTGFKTKTSLFPNGSQLLHQPAKANFNWYNTLLYTTLMILVVYIYHLVLIIPINNSSKKTTKQLLKKMDCFILWMAMFVLSLSPSHCCGFQLWLQLVIVGPLPVSLSSLMSFKYWRSAWTTYCCQACSNSRCGSVWVADLHSRLERRSCINKSFMMFYVCYGLFWSIYDD